MWRPSPWPWARRPSTPWPGERVLQISQEAIIGVSYAIAAAAALFLIGIAPGGHVHTQHMLAGSILWASWTDLLVCALVFAAVGICFYALRRPFQRISSDYDGAVRDGMRVVGWDFLFYALLGVVITFAVRIGGVVVVFAFLIIPATLSAIFTAHLGRRLLITWGAGTLGAALGLLFADRLDFSVGPAVALFLGVELALAGLWRRGSPLLAGAVVIVIAVGYFMLLVADPSPHGVARSVPEDPAPPSTEAAPPEASPGRVEPLNRARARDHRAGDDHRRTRRPLRAGARHGDATRSRPPLPRARATLRRSARPALPSGGSAALLSAGRRRRPRQTRKRAPRLGRDAALCGLRQRRGRGAAQRRAPSRWATSTVSVGARGCRSVLGAAAGVDARMACLSLARTHRMKGPMREELHGTGLPSVSDGARTRRRTELEAGRQSEPVMREE